MQVTCTYEFFFMLYLYLRFVSVFSLQYTVKGSGFFFASAFFQSSITVHVIWFNTLLIRYSVFLVDLLNGAV